MGSSQWPAVGRPSSAARHGLLTQPAEWLDSERTRRGRCSQPAGIHLLMRTRKALTGGVEKTSVQHSERPRALVSGAWPRSEASLCDWQLHRTTT
jgi:hypothetical protein